MKVSQKLFDFSLQQIAAESYLHKALAGEITLADALRIGNNNRNTSLPNLDGNTRMTSEMVMQFNDRFEVVDHRGNDDQRASLRALNGTGLSATLFKNKETGNYTLSFRSTEYADTATGGDWSRDGASGADGQIAVRGLALGQLAAAEDYFALLKSSGKLPTGAKLDVTGYSLGGHIATVFTEMHVNDADIQFGETVTFNAPGRGSVNGGRVKEAVTRYKEILSTSLSSSTPRVRVKLFCAVPT